MKIFSERYNFTMDMVSHKVPVPFERYRRVPGQDQPVSSCSTIENCHDSGGTTFAIYFPPASLQSTEE